MEFLYLLFIILTCYLLYRDVINSQWESFITYTKCKKFRNNKLLQYALDDMHIKKYNGNNSKWDLFIPCNYTHVESELIKLNKTQPNQKIFAIDGCDCMVGKDSLYNVFIKNYGRDFCNNFLPETYLLKSTADMRLFKQSFDSKNTYVLKKNIQRKKGIKLTNKYSEIIQSASNGFVVVQKYIPNLF